jgi:hypothetical protein
MKAAGPCLVAGCQKQRTAGVRQPRPFLLFGSKKAPFRSLNYAEEFFKTAGYDISTVLKYIAWTGSVNLTFTFVALGVVDRGGRRPLMLFGARDSPASTRRWGFVITTA